MHNNDINDVWKCINIASKTRKHRKGKYHAASVARASYESARWSRRAVIFVFFPAKNSLKFDQYQRWKLFVRTLAAGIIHENSSC